MRRILDIGHGGFPLGNPFNEDLAAFSRRLPDGTEYHGIDLPMLRAAGPTSGDLLKVEDIMRLESRMDEGMRGRIFLYRMDARRLGFAGGSFLEVHMHNLVTDPRVSAEDIPLILSEAARVLSEGGTIFLSGEAERYAAPKWLAVEDAMIGLGLEAPSTIRLDELTAMAGDMEMVYGYQNGLFIAFSKRRP